MRSVSRRLREPSTAVRMLAGLLSSTPAHRRRARRAELGRHDDPVAAPFEGVADEFLDAADLIRAIADLIQAIGWPLAALTLVLLLRGELPGLAGRLREIVYRSGNREIRVVLDS